MELQIKLICYHFSPYGILNVTVFYMYMKHLWVPVPSKWLLGNCYLTYGFSIVRAGHDGDRFFMRPALKKRLTMDKNKHDLSYLWFL